MAKPIIEDAKLRISVEFKSVNAKYADVCLCVPSSLSVQEIVWHNLAIMHLQRGKIVLSVTYVCKDVIEKPDQPMVCKADYPVLETVIQAALQQCDQRRQVERYWLANYQDIDTKRKKLIQAR